MNLWAQTTLYHLTVDFPTRAEWWTGNLLRDFDTIFFAEGSKMAFRISAGVFSDKQYSWWTRLETCRWLGHEKSPKRNIVILIDSQATIKALYLEENSSRLVGQCRETR